MPCLHLERRPWMNPLMVNYPAAGYSREYFCEYSRYSRILPFQAGKAALVQVQMNMPYFIFRDAKTKFCNFVIIVLLQRCYVYMHLNGFNTNALFL